ncbi:MAG: FtsX-like permease family protein [Pirellulales bacterium]
MSFFRLVLLGLFHHRRLHLAVALGVAAGTAVLTGALLVGDSMRHSLRSLTLERLGRIDEVLVADRFFRQQLPAELGAEPGFAEYFSEAQPGIYLEGSLENPAARGVARATILGCSPQFWSLGAEEGERPAIEPPALGVNDIVLNAPLAEQLQVQAGAEVLVRFLKRSEIPSESALGRKNDDTLVTTRRMTVKAVVPASGLGRFGLRPNQQNPRNAYVPLEAIQNSLDQKEKINAILVAGRSATETPSPKSVAALEELLKPRLADYGLSFEEIELPKEQGRYYSLISDRMLLPDHAEQAARAVFDGRSLQESLVYLANTIAPFKQPEGAEEPPATPYSTIAALDFAMHPPLGPFVDLQGGPIGPLADDEIVLNDWTADDLQVQPGDEIAVSYFEPESTHGQTIETTHTFRLKAIVQLAGPAADQHLTPELKGVTDEQSMADWDPPFPYEQSRVRDKDETYWEEHRATPKAFVSLAAGRKLWASRFGRTTSIRIPHRDDMTPDTLAEKLALDPARMGLQFQPVKLQGLYAASGTTPFNWLFLGFSMFIIAAALMLVSLLFRLGVERRSSEIGILLAGGWNQRRVRGLLGVEGLCVAALGGLLGLAGGIGYAWLMLEGLRTWWLGAITTPFLHLHVPAASLLIGYFSGVLVSFATVAWALWRMRNLSVRRLLAGQTGEESTVGGTRGLWWKSLAWAWVAGAVGVGALGASLRGEQQAGAFFGAGFMVLIGSLVLVRRYLRQSGQGSSLLGQRGALGRLALRNLARNPRRSSLTIGLVASATFLIAAISAFRLDPPESYTLHDSGSGGFALVGESDPLFFDLNTPDGRRELGFDKQDEVLLAGTKVFSLRARAGDDASCLNLYQTTQPRILSVPPGLIERGGFTWGGHDELPAEQSDNPWTLLQASGDAVPVVVDFNTATYSLHKSLGDTLELAGDDGQPFDVKIVGLLKNSIFQGDVLMSEANFLRHFPDQAGYRFFLIGVEGDAPLAEVEKLLAGGLYQKGFESERTVKRLAEFMTVQNTYLSTFQSLGGLGLLLGTFGLATVQLRNVFERRGELALMRAAGFRRSMLARLVTLENAALLVGGLALGLLAALVAVAPHLAGGGAGVPWQTLAGTLGLVLVVGLLAGQLAVRATLRAPLLPALRGD